MNNQRAVSLVKNAWFLILLVASESVLFVFFNRTFHAGFQLFPLVTAIILFSAGLIPLFIKPAVETGLTACVAVLLAGLILIPDEILVFPFTNILGKYDQNSAVALIRMFQAIWIAPMAVHLAWLFSGRKYLRSWMLVIIYSICILFYGSMIAFWQETYILTILLIGFIWFIGLVSTAFFLLLKAADFQKNDNEVKLARLVLMVTFTATIGLILKPVLFLTTGWVIPYSVILVFVYIFPVGLVYITFRFELFGIDSFLRRVFAYGVFSILIVMIYLAIAVGLSAFLSERMPQYTGLAFIGSIFLVALLFEPMKVQSQKLMDRLFFPERIKFRTAMVEIGQQLSGVVSKKDVEILLNRDLPESIGARWGVFAAAPGPETPGYHEDEPAWSASLQVGSQYFGRYWLGPRTMIPVYEKEEKIRLGSLIHAASLALAYADTIEKLETINKELEMRVEERTRQNLSQQKELTILEERRRMARELHDSVTQSLFSMHLSSRAIKNMVAENPQRAGEELDSLEKTAKATLAEMRSLLQQLRSTETGFNLRKELDHLCVDLHKRGLEIILDFPESVIVSEDIQEDVYKIIREGLNNALLHSGAENARCEIFETENADLKILVIDHGKGFQTGIPKEGHYGLTGMRERVNNIHGHIDIQSMPGSGTNIEVTIPSNKKDTA